MNDYETLLALLSKTAQETINGVRMGTLRYEYWRDGNALIYTSVGSKAEVWYYFKDGVLINMRIWDQ